MKKLMFIAAVAACAIQAQAATTWTATIDFGTDYSGYSVWAVNAWNKSRPDHYPTETAPINGCTGAKINYKTALDGAATPEAQIAILNNTVNSDFGLTAYQGMVSMLIGRVLDHDWQWF